MNNYPSQIILNPVVSQKLPVVFEKQQVVNTISLQPAYQNNSSSSLLHTCGEEMISVEVYSTNHSYYKNQERNIMGDLSKYPFSENIKNMANQVYIEKGRPKHRKQKRIFLLFACTYEAYKRLGIPFYPKQLAAIFGIKDNDIPKALKMLNTYSSNQSCINISKPSDYIEKLANEINIPKQDNELLINFVQNILINDNNKFDNFAPQKVAVVMICYFCKNIGCFQINDKTILTSYHIAQPQYKEITSLIHELYN